MSKVRQGHHSSKPPKSPRLRHQLKLEAERNTVKSKNTSCIFDNIKDCLKIKKLSK